MWTADDEKQLAELQARKDAHETERYSLAVRIVAMLKDEEDRVSGEALGIHAGKIRDLLKPFDDGAREWPAPAQPVPLPFPYKPPRWMKAEDVPDRVSGGHGVEVSRLKRMGPESGNTGYWFVDPDAYSIGPFETPEECEAFIARRYIEEPPAPPHRATLPYPYTQSPPQTVCNAKSDGTLHQWRNVNPPWKEPHYICEHCGKNWRPHLAEGPAG